MTKRLLGDSSMRKVIPLCGVVALLVCLVPLSSAGINANIVIENVKPTALLPGETKELTLTIKNAGSYDAVRITLNFQRSRSPLLGLQAFLSHH
jgi:hypothetical protein